MTFNIVTLGCKVNTYESEYIYSLFIKKGFSYVEKNADIYVVNTCTVTNMADKKSRQTLHSIKKNNPSSIIVACGCYTQNIFNEGKVDNIDADIIVGNKDKSKIVDFVNDYIINRNKILKFYDMRKQEFEDMMIEETHSRTRAFVKIEDGCNNFCSFCVIPFTRGNIRSKKHEEVISEIKSLVKHGYKEVVLTGIHTGAYNDNGYDFANLLEDLVKIEGLIRLRISSIEINELNDRVLKIIEKSDILVPHFHVPLQSGSDSVLKLMNRKYDTKFFEEKINLIRSIKKDVNFTTDVIVAFPSETEQMHNESMEFIKKIGFSKVHVFPYSDRYNTVASKIKEKVDPKVKKERVSELLQISKDLQNDFVKKYIGRDMLVLFENENEGHTANFIKIKTNEEHVQNEISLITLSEDNIVLDV